MRQNRTWLILAAGLAIALGAGSASANYAHVGGWSSIPVYRTLEEPFWSKTLPELSEAPLEARVLPLDRMGLDGSEVFRLLERGVFDSASTVGDHIIGDAPALAGLDLPALAFDIDTARQVVDAYREQVARIVRERYQAELLAITPYPAQMLFCREPVNGLEDLAGRQIRVSGRSTADFLEAFRAEGTTLAFQEVPGALDRGLLDCAITGSITGYNAGWHELTNHLYPMPIGGWDYLLTAMNGNRWASLPETTRQRLSDRLVSEYEAPAWAVMDQLTQEGVACLTGQGPCPHGEPGGMKCADVSEADRRRAREALEANVLPAWADRITASEITAWNDSVGEVTGLMLGPR